MCKCNYTIVPYSFDSIVCFSDRRGHERQPLLQLGIGWWFRTVRLLSSWRHRHSCHPRSYPDLPQQVHSHSVPQSTYPLLQDPTGAAEAEINPISCARRAVLQEHHRTQHNHQANHLAHVQECGFVRVGETTAEAVQILNTMLTSDLWTERYADQININPIQPTNTRVENDTRGMTTTLNVTLKEQRMLLWR